MEAYKSETPCDPELLPCDPDMGIVLLSDEARGTNTFGGNKWMFLDTLYRKGRQDFLSEFNQKVERKVKRD